MCSICFRQQLYRRLPSDRPAMRRFSPSQCNDPSRLFRRLPICALPEPAFVQENSTFPRSIRQTLVNRVNSKRNMSTLRPAIMLGRTGWTHSCAQTAQCSAVATGMASTTRVPGSKGDSPERCPASASVDRSKNPSANAGSMIQPRTGCSRMRSG